MNQHAAVAVKRDARAIFGQITCQEGDATSDIVRFANATKRNAVQNGLMTVFWNLAFVDVGCNQAGCDAVDAYAGPP